MMKSENEVCNSSDGNKSDSSNLIWQQDNLREIINHYRIIPQFIGNEAEIVQKVRTAVDVSQNVADDSQLGNGKQIQHHKTVLEKVKPLPFPVVLWPEQQQYLEESVKALTFEKELSESFHESEDFSYVRKRRSEETKNSPRSMSAEKREKSSVPVIDRFIKKDSQTELEGFFDTHPASISKFRKINSSHRRLSVQREEWFRYQVFHFFQHYKVMQQPLPSYHSLNILPTGTFPSLAVNISCPKTDRKVTDSSSPESEEVLARKYLIGPGDIYAGDYTLYKGVNSPADGHSVATVRINYETTIPALDLLAFCRVQNKVAKNAIIAFPSKDLSEVSKETLHSKGKRDADGEESAHFLVFNFHSVALRPQQI